MKEIPQNRSEFSVPKEELNEDVQSFHLEIVSEIRKQMLQKEITSLSQIATEASHGDVTYEIDLFSEKKIDKFAQKLSKKIPLRVIAEGIGQKDYLNSKDKPEITVIIDPIDGTRGLMYDIRSAFILTGIAPFKDGQNNLSDISLAIQTEVPTTKQNKISQLYAIKNKGAFERIINLDDNSSTSYKKIHSSSATDVKHGFATFVDFFPGSKVETSQLAENVYSQILGPTVEGKGITFNDQYICNAGQIYLLSTGRYRFVADLRPEFEKKLNKSGKKLALSAHPYDLSTILIAQEAGVIITNAQGETLSDPLDTDTNCSWIAYANDQIRQQIEPVLLKEIKKI
jgi:fructose-1,6-bisphosphatase/inositol monophosphatase family enzyme